MVDVESVDDNQSKPIFERIFIIWSWFLLSVFLYRFISELVKIFQGEIRPTVLILNISFLIFWIFTIWCWKREGLIQDVIKDLSYKSILALLFVWLVPVGSNILTIFDISILWPLGDLRLLIMMLGVASICTTIIIFSRRNRVGTQDEVEEFDDFN